jgi:membrane-associated protease RseP (regulator of RpoE activity)
MLGVTNALPAYPFDGGYVFRGWVDALYEKLGHRDKEERERRADEITRNVSTLMIFLYVLLIVAILI